MYVSICKHQCLPMLLRKLLLNESLVLPLLAKAGYLATIDYGKQMGTTGHTD